LLLGLKNFNIMFLIRGVYILLVSYQIHVKSIYAPQEI